MRYCRGGQPSQYAQGICHLANTCVMVRSSLVMVQGQKARRAVPVSTY